MDANEIARQFLSRVPAARRGTKITKRQYEWLRDTATRDGVATAQRVVLDGLTEATPTVAYIAKGWVVVKMGASDFSIWRGSDIPTGDDAICAARGL